MTTYAEPSQLTFEQQTPGDDLTHVRLAPHEVQALMDEMAGLARGLFGLLADVIGPAPTQTRAAGFTTGETTALPVEQHPAAAVDRTAAPAAPVLQSVEMPAIVPTVAAAPPASVPMPEPVTATLSVPMPPVPMSSLPMPSALPTLGAAPQPTSIPMPGPSLRSNPTLAAALLDEISFLDD